MNILVYDVAASSHGVLSILHDFYKSVKEYGNKDIQWFFVIGKTDLEETENIHVYKMDWAKKSWFHRIYCDCVTMPKFIKEHKIDKIISLQHLTVPFTKIPQDIYLHEPMPYTDFVFHFWRKEERGLWVRKHIFGKLVNHSIRKAGTVFVQTDWMRETCSRIVGVSPDKFFCVQPDVDLKIVQKFNVDSLKQSITFFYPARCLVYKNHKVILEAAKILQQQGISNFSVDLTIDRAEDMARACREILPDVSQTVHLKGTIPRENVMEYYARSVLVFPSVVETYGLPVLEARLTGTPILASDMPFCHEILDGYENVQFFDPDSAQDLAQLMKPFIEQTYTYHPVADTSRAQQNNWQIVLNKIVAL